MCETHYFAADIVGPPSARSAAVCRSSTSAAPSLRRAEGVVAELVANTHQKRPIVRFELEKSPGRGLLCAHPPSITSTMPRSGSNPERVTHADLRAGLESCAGVAAYRRDACGHSAGWPVFARPRQGASGRAVDQRGRLQDRVVWTFRPRLATPPDLRPTPLDSLSHPGVMYLKPRSTDHDPDLGRSP